MTDNEKIKWADILKNLNLLQENEIIEEHTAGDYYKFGQNRGHFIFTNEAIIFTSKFAVHTYKMPYKDIKEIKTCFVGPFIPTGIKLTVFDENKGKNVKHKLSVLYRKNWISYITEKSGISVL